MIFIIDSKHSKRNDNALKTVRTQNRSTVIRMIYQYYNLYVNYNRACQDVQIHAVHIPRILIICTNSKVYRQVQCTSKALSLASTVLHAISEVERARTFTDGRVGARGLADNENNRSLPTRRRPAAHRARPEEPVAHEYMTCYYTRKGNRKRRRVCDLSLYFRVVSRLLGLPRGAGQSVVRERRCFLPSSVVAERVSYLFIRHCFIRSLSCCYHIIGVIECLLLTTT